MPTKRNKPTLKVTNIPAYLNWWYAISKLTFIATPIGNYYVVNGIRVRASEFELSMPMPVLIKNKINKGKLADGRVIE